MNIMNALNDRSNTKNNFLLRLFNDEKLNMLILLFIFITNVAFAQSTGDYRSNIASGNWNNLASWQRYNGGSWATPTAGEGFPGQNASPNTVTIRSNHNILLNTNVTNPINNLIVGDGSTAKLETNNSSRTIVVNNSVTVLANATLDLEQMNFTNNGITTIQGLLTVTNTSGAVFFNGKLIVLNGGVVDVPVAETFTFRNGIQNDGTINKTGTGEFVFDTNNQILEGNGFYSLNGRMRVNNITLSNQAPQLSLTSTGTTVITGTGVWEQAANTEISISGSTINIANLNASADNSTVIFNRAGTQSLPANASFYNLILSQSGSKTLTANTSILNNFTIESGVTFNPAGFDITVDGLTTINGTINDATVAGINSYQNVNLSGGTMNGATASNTIVNGSFNVQDANGTIARGHLTIKGTTRIMPGISLTSSNGTSIKTFENQVVVDGSWISTAITTSANLVFQSGIVNNNAGSNFTAGAATFSTNNQSLSGVGSYSFASPVIISGAITLTNESSHANGLTFISTVNGNNAGSTLSNGIGKSIFYNNATTPMNLGIINASALNNNFYYNRAGNQNIKGGNYYNLIFGVSGTKTSIGNINIANDFEILTGNSFNPAGLNIDVAGTTKIAGTYADGTLAGTSTLNHVDISGGSMNGATNGTLKVNGNLLLPNGDATIGRVNLTLYGNLTVPAGRTITFNNNNGIKAFANNVVVYGSWISTAIVTSTNLVFQSGIVNNNAGSNFTAGAATFSTNNQSLSGVGSYSFASPVIISGAITLTNESSHANGLTFISTVNGNNAGSTLSNGIGKSIFYNNANEPMILGIINASALNSNFYYNSAGNQNISGGNYYNLIFGVSGTKTSFGNIKVANNFEILTGNSFNPAGLNIDVAGTTKIAGTYADGTPAGTSTLNQVDISGGTINGAGDGIIQVNGNLLLPNGNATIGRANLTLNGNLTVPAGRTITFNNNNGIKSFVNNVVVNGAWISTAIVTSTNLVFQNGIVNNNAGSNFTAGAATFSTNNQSLSGVGSYSFASPVIISGAITLTASSTHANGIILNNTINGTNVNSTLAIAEASTVNYQPGATTVPMATGNLTALSASATFNYSRANNQFVKNGTYGNLGLINSGTKSLIGNITVIGNLNINTSTLDVTAANYDIALMGAWTIAGGSFLSRAGTVSFTGNSQQTILSGGSNFFNIVFNNSASGIAAIELNDDMNIDNLCTMTDGIINTGSNRLILNSTVANNLTGFNSGSFVHGNLRRNIAINTSLYEFPVGDNFYQRASIKNNNLLGIAYIDANFGMLTKHDDADMSVNDGAELEYTYIAPGGVWQLEPNNQPTGGSYDVYLYTTNISQISDNQYAILKRPVSAVSAAEWSNGGGTINPKNGEGRKLSDGYALRMNLTSFSEFGIGGTDLGNSIALPIELVSFKADFNANQEVDISWVTATEINNEFFTLERSTNALEFETIEIIKGAGNSNQSISYHTVDKKPLPGVSYYRLKQTDFDGTFTYSKIVAVKNNTEDGSIENIEKETQKWSVFPNPIRQGNVLNLSSSKNENSITVEIYDSFSGKKIVADTFDTSIHAMQIPYSLSPGVYLLRMNDQDKITTKRIVVQ